MLSQLLVLGTCAATVAAHAFVSKVTLGGVPYDGWFPFDDLYASPIPARIVRRVPSDSPITDRYSPDLACNIGGNDSNGLTGDISAGATIDFTWSRWPDDHRGPITVMLASCKGSCSTFKATDADWFAIDKKGLSPDGTWATQQMISNGVTWSVQIPSNLQAGEYLARIELLAMHSTGAPQFYPSCSQIRVTGGGNGGPAPGETIKITDLYKGYEFPNIWGTLSGFTIAGPEVASFVSGSSPPPAAPSTPPKEDAYLPVQPTASSSTTIPTVAVPENGIAPPPSVTNPPKIENPLCKRRVLKKRKAALAKRAAKANAAAEAEPLLPLVIPKHHIHRSPGIGRRVHGMQF